MDWKQRAALSLKHFKPSDYDYRVDVVKLRASLFPKGKIPLDVEDSWTKIRIPIYNRPERLFNATVICKKSQSTGTGMRGFRLFIVCPECGQQVSAGRVHQHYGYRHTQAK